MPSVTRRKYNFKWPRKDIIHTFTVYLLRFIIFCDDGTTKEGMKCGLTENIMQRFGSFCSRSQNMELTSIDYVYVNDVLTMNHLEKWALFCFKYHSKNVTEDIMSICGGQTECYYYDKDAFKLIDDKIIKHYNDIPYLERLANSFVISVLPLDEITKKKTRRSNRIRNNRRRNETNEPETNEPETNETNEPETNSNETNETNERIEDDTETPIRQTISKSHTNIERVILELGVSKNSKQRIARTIKKIKKHLNYGTDNLNFLTRHTTIKKYIQDTVTNTEKTNNKVNFINDILKVVKTERGDLLDIYEKIKQDIK